MGVTPEAVVVVETRITVDEIVLEAVVVVETGFIVDETVLEVTIPEVTEIEFEILEVGALLVEDIDSEAALEAPGIESGPGTYFVRS